MIEQLKQAGAPDEVIQAAQKRIATSDEHCEVWEDNWLSLEVFLFLSTQWNVVQGGVAPLLQGIRYEIVPLALRRFKVPFSDRDRMWDDIRLMERAAKEVMNKT